MAKVFESQIRITAALSSTFAAVTGNAAKAVAKLGERAAGLQKLQAGVSSFSQLQFAAHLAQERLEAAARAEREFRDGLGAIGPPTRKQAAEVERLARSTGHAETELAQAQAALAKEGAALRSAGVDVSNLGREHERLAARIAATSRLQTIAAARANLGAAWKRTSEAGAKLGDSVRSVGADVVRLGAIVAGAGAGVVGLVAHTAEAGDEALDMAERLGIGVEALQELRYAGERTGASVEEVNTAMTRLSVSIGKAASAKKQAGGKGPLDLGDTGDVEIFAGEGGGGGAATEDAFKKIGLNAKELARLAPEDQMARIADAFVKLPSHAIKAARAQEIFGRGGVSMVPLLEQGSAGLARLRSEAQATGGVLSRSAAQDASDFKDAMQDARLSIGGVVRTLGAALLPVATDVMRQFSGWVRENRGQIVQWAQGVARWIGERAIPTLRRVIPAVIAIGGAVASVTSGVAKFVGGWDNLAIIIAAVRFAPVVSGILGMIGPLAALAKSVWAVNVAMFANPIGLLVIAGAALIATIALMILYWDKVVIAADRAFLSMREAASFAASFTGGPTGLFGPKAQAAVERDLAQREDELARREISGRDTFMARLQDRFAGRGAPTAAEAGRAFAERQRGAFPEFPSLAAIGAGGSVSVSAPITIEDGARGATEANLDKQLAVVRKEALRAYDERAARRRRTSLE